MWSRLVSRFNAWRTSVNAAVAAYRESRFPRPTPGETVVWWNIFTGDSHYYRLDVTRHADPHGNDDMPWSLVLIRDRQFYEQKWCPDLATALDLQAGWRRMVRLRGLGRVYWIGFARMGRFDILVFPRDTRWRLLLFVKDRYVETRDFPTEADAVIAANDIEQDFASRPWFAWEVPPQRPRR